MEIPNGNYLVSVSNDCSFSLKLQTINGCFDSSFYMNNKPIDYDVKFRFAEYLYTGTEFIGSFYRLANGSLSFFLSDVLTIANKPQHDISLSYRILEMYNILKNDYIWDEFMNFCYLEIKPYFLVEQLSRIKEHPQFKQIYFHPESKFDPVICTKLNTIIIKKETVYDCIKVNIVSSKNVDIYNIYDLLNNKYLGKLGITTLEHSYKLSNHFKKNNSLISYVVWNSKFKKYILK